MLLFQTKMILKKALEIVDKTSRNFCNIDRLIFAEKLIILCEDCRQILPVVKNGTKFNTINEKIKFPYIWHQFFVLWNLKKYMRSCDREFSEFLLKTEIFEAKMPIVANFRLEFSSLRSVREGGKMKGINIYLSRRCRVS